MSPQDIKLSRIPPASLHLSRAQDDRAEPTFKFTDPHGDDSSQQFESGADPVEIRTPVIDRRLSLSFSHQDDDDDGEYQHDINGGNDFPTAESSRRADKYGRGEQEAFDSDDEKDERAPMDPNGRSYHKEDSGTGQPLLSNQDDERGRSSGQQERSREGSPFLEAQPSSGAHFNRRSALRSRSPDTQAKMAARKKYMYAALFLVISLVSFSVQTELAAYVQVELGWNKAYCMLYLTHGSWSMLWPVQLLVLRVQKWKMPWKTFWRRHVYLLRSTAHMVRNQELEVSKRDMAVSPWPYLLRTTAMVTTALTVAGLTWYLAVDMTSPSDLTAIYNCSAFFAYAFSVPLLKEQLRWDKSIAVLIAISGVLVVAYGDTKPSSGGEDKSAGLRFMGNIIIGGGSVLYGLYEVLYKRWACPPEKVSAGRGMIFANTFGSCIGIFTLSVLWIPLPLLHWSGIETFELPTGETAFWLWLSVVMNATFAGSFLVLISLTSPVLSSVASLLTIFIIAIADWVITGENMSLAAIVGGILIVVAFLMLSWSTWREMVEAREREAALGGPVEASWDSDDDDKDDDDERQH